MKIVPITLKQAARFTSEHHRHNIGAHAHKFSIGLENDDKLIGIATAARPASRILDDGNTLEISRVCVLDGYRNANSKLYGAVIRAGTAMGYERFVTYTLITESGSSLKAVGFEFDGYVRDKNWNTPSRPRETNNAEKYPHGEKIRWILTK